MSDDKNSKPVKIDPQCIQEALQIYLPAIKHDDPKLAFYTMYEREATQRDTEYSSRTNEDLSITLLFAGLLSTVSSAFIIYVQPQLKPDSGDRSEAYLRAILLTLNPSISPHEDPSAPPAWDGPPAEIITTLNLLYGSLFMSLSTGFIGMLAKQCLNRYLNHTGGSMVERCSDRQRKCDGFEAWPLRLFIDSVSGMLLISLLLFACGLSRYTWSVNTSVGQVVITFTVLGFLFYIGVVVAGTSSYECPFQTPASSALRHLKDNVPSPPKITSFISATRKSARIFLALPSFTSLIYATWMDAREVGRNLGDEAIILLFQIDKSVRDAVEWITQEIRSIRRGGMLPTTRDPNNQQLPSRNVQKPLVRVRDLEDIRKQNKNDALCVSWVLRKITDSEAIDFAIRLAGNIRWFDGGPTDNPPYDLIVSIFWGCFDPTNQLYPEMRDRAYLSARAILQMKTRAGVQPHDNASRYPVPIIPSSPYEQKDPDLHNILYMLEQNFVQHKPTLRFPRGDTKTHLRWMTNLFVDSICISPNPTLEDYRSYLSTATAGHQASIANILLVWYILLGGRVEEETLWAVNKSDSLETILSHLSTRVMSTIADGTCIHHLNLLLEFLAAWEKRPECLTRMVCQWCSTISEAVKSLHPGETRILPPHRTRLYAQFNIRLRPQDMKADSTYSDLITDVFSAVRTDRDSGGSNATHSQVQYSLPPFLYEYLLSILLEVGFRRTSIDTRFGNIDPDDTPHHRRIFETAFSSDNDEVVADAVRMWITSTGRTTLGSFARHFTKRLERDRPLSEGLRQLIIDVVERIWDNGQWESGPEAVRLLNSLDADMDGLGVEQRVDLLGRAMCGPGGLELSRHYWRLLGRFLEDERIILALEPKDWEIMRTLRNAGDWEKLEVWMLLMWKFLPWYSTPESTEDVNIQQVTLELLSQRPSALQKFENICGVESSHRKEESNNNPKRLLRDICRQARAKNTPSEVSSELPQLAPPQRFIPLDFVGDDSF